MRIKWAGLLLIGVGLGLVLTALFLASGFFNGLTFEDREPKAGEAAIDFSLADLDGNTIRLSSLRGKAVVVNFWATWCDPCKDEMPLLAKAAGKYTDQLVVLGVNDGESTAVVQDFVNEYRITFPILLDLDSRVSWKYAVNAYPTTYFIDQEGNVQAIHLGLLSESTLATQLGKVGIQ